MGVKQGQNKDQVKVAVDKGPLESEHKVRGVGAYVGELTKELINLSTNDLKIEAVDFGKADLEKYDIVHYPYFHPFFTTLPKEKPAKTVVTIHDLIPLIYPEHYQPGIKGRLRFILQKYLIKKTDFVIVPSQTSKKDVVRFLGLPQEKISVIYEAPKKIFRKISDTSKLKKVKSKYNLPDKFVLYVGDVNYNKNILGLVKACRKADIPLVICGKHAVDIEDKGIDLVSLRGPRDWIRFLFEIPHPEVAHYKELVKEIEKGEVVRTGFVPDEDLVGIYNLASVYCQASFYEGFGLPVLEAMATGTPVVVGKTNALVEVAGEAALVADPKSPGDIAEKIKKVIGDKNLREELVKKGAGRAKEFSWKKAAEETVEVYKTIINEQ